MIKKYNQFISESFSKEIHHSIGEYIEQLAKNDEYVQMIVSQITDKIEPHIRLSNAVNLLDDLKKVELLKRVENYLNGVEGSTDVSATVDINSLEKEESIKESYGKNVLTTFFKCLTALGYKENSQETKEIPQEFLVYFKFPEIDSQKLKSIFNRFKSLQSIQIDYTNPTTSLYFGIKCVNFEDIQLMSKIKLEMEKFNPGYFEQKIAPQINDRLIIFGYYGVGKWDNGQLDLGEFENIKSNLKSFLIKYKWSEKIQLNIVPSKFWVYIQIKLK